MHPFLGKRVSHLCISEDTKLKGHRLLRRRGLKMQLPCRMSQLGMWSRIKRCYTVILACTLQDWVTHVNTAKRWGHSDSIPAFKASQSDQ